MAAARADMVATYPSRALPRSSLNPCFRSSVARVTVGLAAVPTSGSSEKDSHNKDRLSMMLESGIWSKFPADTLCHVAALETIEKDIDKLELVLMQSEEESYRSELSSDAVFETQSKFDILKSELCRLQTLLELKEDSLYMSLLEGTNFKTLLQETQVRMVSLSLYKEVNEGRQAEELLRLEKSSGDSLDIFDKHLLANVTMKNVQEKIQNVWESIVNSHSSLVCLKLIEILQSEASLSLEALLITTKELEQEKSASSNLLSKFQKSVEDLKERDLHINRLQQELANANHRSDMVSKEVSRSEAEVLSLREKVISTEGMLRKERRALRAARDGLEQLDQALSNEESKVDDLFKEVSSLKAQLEQKEKIILRLTDDARRDKGLAETARKHLDGLHQSEKKVEQLVMQCSILENQIRSRDLLLDEIKKEAFKSTEALKIAAQIKQDLNHSKQRELELTQDLERERIQVKDLSRELMENSRAVRAELALGQVEKDVMNLTRELALLKNGIQSRDDVIKIMEEKIEGSLDILRSASADREDALSFLKLYLQDSTWEFGLQLYTKMSSQ